MARKAHLVGVCSYRIHQLSPLPIIRNDFVELRQALTKRGFEVEAHGTGDTGGGAHTEELGRNSILAIVSSALTNAGSEDDLLIFLSGHGIHIAGRDYLVPSDAHLDEAMLEEFLVPLDFSGYLHRSRAKNILFVVDACREGVEISTKSIQRWASGKIAAANHRRVATMYGCGAGEFSSFVSGESGFSLFSRAFSGALSATGGRAFLDAIQVRLDELAREHGKRQQHVRCRAESGVYDDDEETVRWVVDGDDIRKMRVALSASAGVLAAPPDDGPRRRRTIIITASTIVALIVLVVGGFLFENSQAHREVARTWAKYACCLADGQARTASDAWAQFRSHHLLADRNVGDVCEGEHDALTAALEDDGQKESTLYHVLQGVGSKIAFTSTNTSSTFTDLYASAEIVGLTTTSACTIEHPSPGPKIETPLAQDARLAGPTMTLRDESLSISLPDVAFMTESGNGTAARRLVCLLGPTGPADCRALPKAPAGTSWELAQTRAPGAFPLLRAGEAFFRVDGSIVPRAPKQAEGSTLINWATVDSAGNAAILQRTSSGVFQLSQEIRPEVRSDVVSIATTEASEDVFVGDRFVGSLTADESRAAIAQPIRVVNGALGEATQIAATTSGRVTWHECTATDGSGAIVVRDRKNDVQHIAWFTSMGAWNRGQAQAQVFETEADSAGFLYCRNGGLGFINLYSDLIEHIRCEVGGCTSDTTPVETADTQALAAIGDKTLLVFRRAERGGWYMRFGANKDLRANREILLLDDAVLEASWTQEPWVISMRLLQSSGRFAGLIIQATDGIYLYRVMDSLEVEPVEVRIAAAQQMARLGGP